LLLAWREGDGDALNELIPLIHGELRRLASRHMRRERPGHTLQATALINEAYLRLIEVDSIEWQNRAHFLAVAARVMRRVLVESARRKARQRHGGNAHRISFEDALTISREARPDFVALDDALRVLTEVDARKARVVEMRFFGGLTVAETAEALCVSTGTVMRDWRLAKAWLARELKGA
jgi:RNA polymerase sigma-70 factor (ECF subfamily)